jgi:hypothetical protein
VVAAVAFSLVAPTAGCALGGAALLQPQLGGFLDGHVRQRQTGQQAPSAAMAHTPD